MFSGGIERDSGMKLVNCGGKFIERANAFVFFFKLNFFKGLSNSCKKS